LKAIMAIEIRKILTRLALSGFLAGAGVAAHAADNNRVALAFGNTVMSVYPDGRFQKIWMHPDGTWNGQSRRGTPLAGAWLVKGEQVCVKQTSPRPPLPLSFCMPFPENPQMGVSWASRDLAGTPINLKIVKGMAEAKAAAGN
jgi:hypothetical protein